MTLGIRSRLALVSLALIGAVAVASELYLCHSVDPQLTARAGEAIELQARLLASEAAARRRPPPPPASDRAGWDALAQALVPRQARLAFFEGAGPGGGRLLGAASELDPEADALVAAEPLAPGAPARLLDDPIGGRLLQVAVAVPPAHDLSERPAVRLELTASLGSAERTAHALHRALALACLIAALGALGLSGLAAHWMSRVVAELSHRARRLASGAADVRARSAGGHEFGELGRAVDQLAESLLSALRDLRTERDLLRSVLETMQEGVLVLDADGRIDHVNPALREMLLLASDLKGRSPLEALRNADLQALLQRTRTRGEPDAAELEIAGLKPRRLLVRAAPLPGEPGGLVAAFVDLTRLRQLETLRRDFVANVSHELRTPVAAIRSAAETLSGAARDNPAAAARFIDMIERNAARMQRLVDDLLDLARIEAREFQLDLAPVDLAAAIEQVLGLARDRAEAKRLGLDSAVAPGVRVLADRRALDQILTNLVDNAIKYCGDGAFIRVRAAVEGARVRVAVEDSGPGIEAKHLGRLFERFYRVDAGRSRELGGTGLGLSIVKHLTEAMGGSVGVESTPGKGAIFSFTLTPAAAPPASALPDAADAQ